MSVLFFYTVLQFLLGRRFHHTNSSKLQLFIVLCVCYSTIILSWGLKTPPLESNTVRPLLVSWLRAYSTRFETSNVKTWRFGRLELLPPSTWQQDCPASGHRVLTKTFLHISSARADGHSLFIRYIPLLWYGRSSVLSVCLWDKAVLWSGGEQHVW